MSDALVLLGLLACVAAGVAVARRRRARRSHPETRRSHPETRRSHPETRRSRAERRSRRAKSAKGPGGGTPARSGTASRPLRLVQGSAASLRRRIDQGGELIPGLRLVRSAPLPQTRPLEHIARDVRRLRLRYRTLPARGVAFAKIEAIRRAYDDALVEACTALGIATLLGVLPDGLELERERERVEDLLGDAGLRLDAA